MMKCAVIRFTRARDVRQRRGQQSKQDQVFHGLRTKQVAYRVHHEATPEAQKSRELNVTQDIARFPRASQFGPLVAYGQQGGGERGGKVERPSQRGTVATHATRGEPCMEEEVQIQPPQSPTVTKPCGGV